MLDSLYRRVHSKTIPLSIQRRGTIRSVALERSTYETIDTFLGCPSTYIVAGNYTTVKVHRAKVTIGPR
jgi:hypothetical protein